MQLLHLRLRNIRSYESADLALGPGTTLITGDVGSGKTSLLHGIEMALFGFAEVEPTYLVRHQASESEVELTLEGNGHRYQFGRKFRRRTRRGRDVFELESASYAEDGQRAAYSVTEIRERAIRLLGFPDNPNPRAHSDLWRWAVYVPQERMREVLAQDPEERLQTVRKALGLEQYRLAAENAQLLATELRRLAELRESRAHGMDHYETDVPRLEAEAEVRVSDLTRWGEEHRARVRDLDMADRAVAELELRRHRVEADAAEGRQLSERIESEEALVKRIQDRLARRREQAGRWTEGRRDARL
ncbi:MAG TPA: AAA family ATPase, partial [Thermoplasmata archaeon]